MVHVIRNPYGSIAIIALVAAIGEDKLKKSYKTIKVYSNAVEQQIQMFYIKQCRCYANIHLDVIEIQGKDFISDSKETLLKICNVLE